MFYIVRLFVLQLTLTEFYKLCLAATVSGARTEQRTYGRNFRRVICLTELFLLLCLQGYVTWVRVLVCVKLIQTLILWYQQQHGATWWKLVE